LISKINTDKKNKKTKFYLSTRTNQKLVLFAMKPAHFTV